MNRHKYIPDSKIDDINTYLENIRNTAAIIKNKTNKTRDDMVTLMYVDNIGMVYSLMRKHHIYARHPEYQDIFYSGASALINAINNYDSTKSKITTYAYYKIRKAIQEAISKTKGVNYGSYTTFVHHDRPYVSLDSIFTKVLRSDEVDIFNFIDSDIDPTKTTPEELENKRIIRKNINGILNKVLTSDETEFLYNHYKNYSNHNKYHSNKERVKLYYVIKKITDKVRNYIADNKLSLDDIQHEDNLCKIL